MAVGTCIAAKNHATFALFVMSGGSAWMACIIAVGMHLNVDGVFASISRDSMEVFLEWPLVIFVPWSILSLLCSGLLLAFGTFHTLALFFQFNTKICWKPFG